MKSFCSDWEEIHKELEWGKYPPESVIRFIARNYYNKKRNEVKILDFGCGAGSITWYLAREGFQVCAFDGSESAIRKATEYLSREGFKDVKFLVSDALEVNYEDNFFDCVIDNVCVCSNTFLNICKMYSKIYSILKDGGKIFTTCFGEKTDGYGYGKFVENGTYKEIERGVLSNRGVVHFWKKDELKEVLLEIGFVNVVIDEMVYTDNGNTVEMYMVQGEKKMTVFEKTDR